MTWGLKIVLDGIACTDWILPNFNLAIISMLCRHAICLWHAQVSFSFRGCSCVYLGCQLDKLHNQQGVSYIYSTCMLGEPFYGSFAS